MDICTMQKHDISSIPWIYALCKSMTGIYAMCKRMTPVPFQGSMHFAKAWHQFHSMDRRTMKKHDTSSIPWIYALCKSMTSIPFHGSMHYAKAWQGSMQCAKEWHQFHSRDLCTLQKHDISSIPWIGALWKSMTPVPFHGYMHYAKAWHQFHSMDLCTMQKHDWDLCTVQKAWHQFHSRDLCTMQKHDISSIPWIYALFKSMTSVPFRGSMHYSKAWHQFHSMDLCTMQKHYISSMNTRVSSNRSRLF